MLFVERFASLLESYWEAAFEAEWQRIEPKLAESVERSGRQIADDGLYAFLLSLAPQLRVDPGGRSFGLDIPHDTGLAHDDPTHQSVNAANAKRAAALMAWMRSVVADQPELLDRVTPDYPATGKRIAWDSPPPGSRGSNLRFLAGSDCCDY